MKACAIILAAGFSTRMAPLFKPLLPLPFPEGEKSALSALCSRYRAEGVLPVAVGGYRAEETRAEACSAGAVFVLNPHPEQGMFSSIAAGMAALPPGCTHFFIHPSDIPLVRRMTIRMLLDRAEKKDAALIPHFRGAAGHPPLFPAGMKGILAEHGRASGLRDAMGHVRREAAASADSLILNDMDSPADYEAMCARARCLDVLAPEEAAELLDIRGVPAKGRAHGLAVGAVAAALAGCLGGELSPSLAEAGGAVHDICKGEKGHESAAGRLFRSWGMERMAWLVESHRDITLAPDAPFTEREAVFLADKFVYGSSFIPMAERFGRKLRLYAGDEAACSAIRMRRSHAMDVLARFERESGREAAAIARETLGSRAFRDRLEEIFLLPA